MTAIPQPSSARQPCPVCGSPRSLSVDVGRNGKRLYFCHAKKDCDVDAWVKAQSGGGSPGRTRTTDDDYISPRMQDYNRFRRALAILRAAGYANAGSPTAYLQARGIERAPVNAMVLPAQDSRRLGLPRFPAMVLPVIDAEGKLLGAHVTWLNLKGVAKLGGTDMPRKTFGRVGGGYVQLAEPDPDRPLLAGEGIETVLSAMQLTGYAGIATLGTSGMKNVRLPACSSVIVCADNGDGGQDAARVLADRVAPERPARIATPPSKYGNDWNDALRFPGADPVELRRLIVKAKRVKPVVIQTPSMRQFLEAEIKPLSRSLDPIFIEPVLAMLHGRAGDGKTPLAVAMAYALATATPLMDWTVARPYRTLYVDAELPIDQLGVVLTRLGPPADQLFIASADWRYRNKEEPFDLASDAGRACLTALIEETRAEVVLLDNLFHLAPHVPDKEIETWNAIARWLRDQKRDGRSVVVLHHDGKGGKQYGTSIREIGFDITMQIAKKPEFDVDDGNEAVAYEFKLGKQRYLYGRDAAPRIIRSTVVNERERADDEYVRWERLAKAADPREQRNEEIRARAKEGAKAEELMAEFGLKRERIRQILKDRPESE